MKSVLLSMVLLMVPLQVQAVEEIELNFTGHRAALINDIPGFSTNNGMPNVGLGGPVGNQAMTYKALEFTVDNSYFVNYVSVDANVKPWDVIFDNARGQYIQERLAEGATPEQIGFELDGFVGPQQSVNIQFDLVKGSIPYQLQLDSDRFIPTDNILATASYTFYTDNSRYETEYKNLLIPLSPFKTEIASDNKYWIAAHDKTSGIYFNYSAGLVGTINTPEPATMLLMGGGLVGMFWRRRKVSMLK